MPVHIYRGKSGIYIIGDSRAVEEVLIFKGNTGREAQLDWFQLQPRGY